MTQTIVRTAAALALILLVVAAPFAFAATQPDQVPGDFANGQSNAFGSVAMEPYLPVGKTGAVPVVAHITLSDLGVVQQAATILVSFNLKGHDTQMVYDRLAGPDGKAITPTKTSTAEHGLQLQAFYAPKDLLAVAAAGRIDLTLTGHAAPKTNGQWQVGALVLAFDAAWGTLHTSDGNNAEVYGFTLLMATGLPAAGLAPFHGMGNGAVAAVLLAVCAAVVAVGAYTLASLLRAGRPITVSVQPLPVPLVPTAPPPPVVHAAVQARAAVPVFGSFDSPVRPGPVQGPRLPPGFVVKPWPATPSAPRASSKPSAAKSATSRPKRTSARGAGRSQA